MCTPAALPALALIGTGVSAAGVGYAALAANAQARGAAAQDAVNAGEARNAAQDAIERGNVEQMRHSRDVSAQMAAQRAAMAANGLDIGFGSAADLVGDTAMYGQEDAAQIAKGTAGEVRGFEGQAAGFMADAASQRAAGRSALIGGALNMGSTIIGGAQQYGRLRASAGLGKTLQNVDKTRWSAGQKKVGVRSGNPYDLRRHTVFSPWGGD